MAARATSGVSKSNKALDDALSRVTNATRSIAENLRRFSQADERLVMALNEAKTEGASEHQLQAAVNAAANGRSEFVPYVERYAALIKERG